MHLASGSRSRRSTFLMLKVPIRKACRAKYRILDTIGSKIFLFLLFSNACRSDSKSPISSITVAGAVTNCKWLYMRLRRVVLLEKKKVLCFSIWYALVHTGAKYMTSTHVHWLYKQNSALFKFYSCTVEYLHWRTSEKPIKSMAASSWIGIGAFRFILMKIKQVF